MEHTLSLSIQIHGPFSFSLNEDNAQMGEFFEKARGGCRRSGEVFEIAPGISANQGGLRNSKMEWFPLVSNLVSANLKSRKLKML